MEVGAQLPSPIVVDQPPHLLGERHLNLERNRFRIVALFAFQEQLLPFPTKGGPLQISDFVTQALNFVVLFPVHHIRDGFHQSHPIGDAEGPQQIVHAERHSRQEKTRWRHEKTGGD